MFVCWSGLCAGSLLACISHNRSRCVGVGGRNTPQGRRVLDLDRAQNSFEEKCFAERASAFERLSYKGYNLRLIVVAELPGQGPRPQRDAGSIRRRQRVEERAALEPPQDIEKYNVKVSMWVKAWHTKVADMSEVLEVANRLEQACEPAETASLGDTGL